MELRYSFDLHFQNSRFVVYDMGVEMGSSQCVTDASEVIVSFVPQHLQSWGVVCTSPELRDGQEQSGGPPREVRMTEEAARRDKSCAVRAKGTPVVCVHP